LPRRRAARRPSAGAAHIDALLQGTDLLQRIGHPPDGNANWPELGGKAEIDAFVARLEALLDGGADVAALAAPTVLPAAEPSPPEPPEPPLATVARPSTVAGAQPQEYTGNQERILRVNAERLDRLLAMAGESMVERIGYGRSASRSSRPGVSRCA
jgi:two-component system sensor histidine kinase and response regulator WspE